MNITPTGAGGERREIPPLMQKMADFSGGDDGGGFKEAKNGIVGEV